MQTHSALKYSMKWVNKEMKLEYTANTVFIVDFHVITPLLRKPSSVPGEAMTRNKIGTSLVVKWLRLRFPIQGWGFHSWSGS